MTTWAALFKKDFRLTRTAFLVGIAINFLILLLTLFVEMNIGENIYMFIPLAVAIVFHVLYLPVMLFISLRTEAGQLHLWLHNPQSAATLFLSKLLNGIIMMAVSLVVLYTMVGVLITSRFSLIEAHWTDTWKAAVLIFPHIILFSILIGVWVMLLWTLYHALKYRMGRWTWLTLFGVIMLTSWVSSLFESSNLYKLLTQWISLKMDFPTFPIDPIPAYAGDYLYYIVFIIGLFYLSTWIMDKKVED